MLRKTFLTAALTTGLVLGSAGIASAHECFIASRSSTGTAAVTNSANWHELTLTDLFSHLPGFLPQLTPAQVERAVAMADAQGIPSSVALFGSRPSPSRRTSGARSPETARASTTSSVPTATASSASS